MVQNVQGRQSQGYAGNARNNQASGARVINAIGNVGGKSTKAQEAEVVLTEEQQDFLADSLEETDDYKDLQLQATLNFKVDHIDAYDSDCDDEATTNAIFMTNLSPVGSLNNDTVAPRYDSNTLSEIVEIVLWYLDSGCSKHMTGHSIMEYGDLQMGNILISHVYYVEGLDHNLFSVGQFCDSDLEVDFRKYTCFVRNLEGVDLLLGSRGSNLYTISMADMIKSSPICIFFKASKMKSWLWHHRLSYLNFGTINKLAKQGLVKGLPKLKYTKDHLCSACQMGKSKKESHPHKPELSTNEKL
ncbi:retrovirus-related pol polyprotein from transposon TNT 1-94 [Tanacetum coccineum]